VIALSPFAGGEDEECSFFNRRTMKRVPRKGLWVKGQGGGGNGSRTWMVIQKGSRSASLKTFL